MSWEKDQLRLKLRVALTPDLERWILGWGGERQGALPCRLEMSNSHQANQCIKRVSIMSTPIQPPIVTHAFNGLVRGRQQASIVALASACIASFRTGQCDRGESFVVAERQLPDRMGHHVPLSQYAQ
jgi:hypothetical protein